MAAGAGADAQGRRADQRADARASGRTGGTSARAGLGAGGAPGALAAGGASDARRGPAARRGGALAQDQPGRTAAAKRTRGRLPARPPQRAGYRSGRGRGRYPPQRPAGAARSGRRFAGAGFRPRRSRSDPAGGRGPPLMKLYGSRRCEPGTGAVHLLHPTHGGSRSTPEVGRDSVDQAGGRPRSTAYRWSRPGARGYVATLSTSAEGLSPIIPNAAEHRLRAAAALRRWGTLLQSCAPAQGQHEPAAPVRLCCRGEHALVLHTQRLRPASARRAPDDGSAS